MSTIDMAENKALVLEGTPDKSIEDLFQIQTQAPPTIINLPYASPNRIFNIDLNTRSINAPSFLSVSRDHKAGVIYFRADRYYDYMDLAETICLVQYILPGTKGKDAAPYTYVVPFFDTQSEEGKIIFPWVIGGPATTVEGKIKYAVRFYRVKGGEAGEPMQLVYNLNTIPATSKIEYGLEADTDVMKAPYDEPISSHYDNLIAQLSNQRTYWTIL
jgi:hypothetical protein